MSALRTSSSAHRVAAPLHSMEASEADRRTSVRHVGTAAAASLGVVLLGFSLSVNFPKAAHGFQSDESTYYSLAHSLARDLDFEFRREDLVRIWEEFPTGPEGIFLKRGKDVDARIVRQFPFIEWVKHDDGRQDRLYYAKSYLYSLVAAPFVRLAGTNGFLVLHAVLMTLNFAMAYSFLAARSRASAALLFALAFLFASAAPVYFVWLTPDFFNLSLVLCAYFLWSYKEVADPRFRLLRSTASDWAAAAVLGMATFSKPLNVLLIAPLLLTACARRQWRRGSAVAAVFGAVVVALFLVNVAITGEFNYQGGDRRTFYGQTGFPFQDARATFDMVGESRATDRVPVEVLVNRDAWEVFRHNLVYFTLGRHTGLVPYFFPAVLSVVLFLLGRGRRAGWQSVVGGTALASILVLLVYMPFTYSGGGGPIGNRYFLSIYPAFLFITPPLGSPVTGLAALGIGSVFTAQLVLNPFYTSFYPAEHAKRGAFRLLPVELSLVNDLPVNVTPSRAKQPLGGAPPITAYFLDDNAYAREGERFWVKGNSRAEMIIRAPARARPRDGGGANETLRIRRLRFEIQTGDVANRVTVEAGSNRRTVQMNPAEMQVVEVKPGRGLPYRPYPAHPTNYVYLASITSETGFVPLFSSGSRDNRFLGALIKVVPVYE